MFDLSPDQVRAIVVGIHHYDYHSAWELRGPADDALRMVDWLIGRGLQQNQIALFLSPASWQEPPITRWAENNSWTQRFDATQDGIRNYIDKQLAKLGGSALFFYWGGHGLVSSDQDQNYLLVADSTEENTYYVNLQTLFDALKRKKFAHLCQQLCIVDACAISCEDVASEINLSPITFTKGASEHSKIEQCYLFSASPGKYAENDSINRTGVFSRNLFSRLPSAATPASLSDFVSIFREVRLSCDLESQTPCIVWLKGENGDQEKAGSIPRMPNAAAQLLSLVRRIKIEPRLCKRLYLRCLPNATRFSTTDGLEHWVRDLADIPKAAGALLSPLIEFAVRVGRATGKATLLEWAEQQCEPEQFTHLINRLRDEESEQGLQYTTLYLELEEPGNSLRWWLWAEQQHLRTVPVSIELTPKKLRDSLKKTLPKILNAVYERITGDNELRVSLLLPHDQLSAGLEDIQLQLTLDGMRSTKSLYQRYPLVLHWNRRASSSTRAKWKTVTDILQQRIDQGSGTAIQWLELGRQNPHEAAKNQLISGTQQAICVGLDGIGTQAAAMVKSIQECLQQGIPCFLWLQQIPTDPDQARTELEHTFGALPAAKVPLSVKRLASDARIGSILPAVRVVWDLPTYMPTSNPQSPLLPGL